MAPEAKIEVKANGGEVPEEKEEGLRIPRRLMTLLRRKRERGESSTTVPANMEGKAEQAPDAKGRESGHDSSTDRPNPAPDDEKAPIQDPDDAHHQENGLQPETSPSQEPATPLDLWADAWIKLDKKTQDLLSSWDDATIVSRDESSKLTKAWRSMNIKDESVDDGQTLDSTTIKSLYVERVIDNATTKLKAYQNRWGTQSNPTPAGKTKEVLVSVLLIKDLIDAGLQFDPLGYASSAWAVVSFGLKLVENDKVRMDLAFEASAECAHFLAKYCKLETHLRQAYDKKDTKAIEKAIVDVYVAIFKYSAAVKKALDGSLISHVKESLKALTAQPLRDLQATVLKKDGLVRDLEELVNRQYQTDSQKHTKRSLEALQASAADMVGKLEGLQVDATAIKQGVGVLLNDAVLNWLSPIDPQRLRIHQNLIESIAKSTEREKHWLLQRQDYLDWKVYPQSVLWLHAPVDEDGCGKSSLCSTVIQDLAAAPESERKVLVYWYFQSNRMDTLYLTLVLRDFLRNLLANGPKNAPLEDVKNWLVERHNRDPPPDKKELLDKVKDVIKRLQRDVFVVLDGLDEFPVKSKGTSIQRKDVLDLITGLVKDPSTSKNLHVLIASTFENDINERLLEDDELSRIVDEVDVEQDLRGQLDGYISWTIENDEQFSKLPTNLKSKIKESLRGGNEDDGSLLHRNRNFRWVISQLDDFRACHGKREIKKQLKRISTNMKQKCQQVLEDVKRQEEPTMRLILVWILRHKRFREPLTVGELAEAALVKDPNELIRILHSWPVRQHGEPLKSPTHETNDKSRSYVELDLSAKENLESIRTKTPDFVHNETGTALPWYMFSDADADRQIAMQCLELLTNVDTTSTSNESSLMKYAAQYWHEHYLDYINVSDGVGGLEGPPEARKLQDLISKLFKAGSPAFRSWLATWNPDNDFEPSLDFDLDADEGDDRDVSNIDSHSSDSEKESQSSGDDQSSSESQSSGDDDSSSQGQSTDDEDSNSEGQIANDDGSHRTGTPFKLGHPVYYAVKLNLINIAIEMIERGSDAQSYADPGKEGTVLQLALFQKQWKVADALLSHSNLSETIIHEGRYPHGTPLYIASARASGETAPETVKTLIQKGGLVNGARPGKQDGKYGSALHAAAFYGNIGVVRLLLETGKADVKTQEGMFGTALHAAAANDHHEIVKELLRHGANPATISGLFGSALQIALANDSDSQRATDILQRSLQKHNIECDNPSGIGWEMAFSRLEKSHSIVLERYVSLFQMPTNQAFQMPTAYDLEPDQTLLARILHSWDLPGARGLSTFPHDSDLADNPLFRASLAEQLDAIQSALPNLTKCCPELEMNRRDFRHRALFWSGINYVLENLELLVERSMESMQDSLPHTIDFPRFLPDRHYGFMDDFESNRAELSLWHRDRFRRAMKPRYGMPLRRMDMFRRRLCQFDDDLEEMDMDVSDQVTVKISQQQQMVQSRLHRDGLAQSHDKKMTLGSIMSSDLGRRDHDEGDGQNDMEIHLVVDNLLPLVKHIVDFGKQCDRLHRTTAQVESDDTVKSLTFEVLAALARLATSINRWRVESRMGRRESPRADSILSETVRLLTTVRLPRITRLAKEASQRLSEAPNQQRSSTRKCVLAGPQMGASGNDKDPLLLLENSADELPALIRAAMAPALKQLRAELYVDMQKLVQDEMKSRQSNGWSIWNSTGREAPEKGAG